MANTDELEKYVAQTIQNNVDGDGPSLDAVKGGREGARDVALSYLYLGDVEEARKWAIPAAQDYLEYARFIAEGHLDPSNPTEPLRSKPWSDALTAMQLATFGGDEDVLTATATNVLDWAESSFLDESRGRENTLIIDATACFAKLIHGGTVSPHSVSLQNYFDAMDDPTPWAIRDKQLGVVAEAIESDNPSQVSKACEKIDECHRDFDEYDSTPMRLINIHSCFCVAFARQHGLDVDYTSDYVPDSLQTY